MTSDPFLPGDRSRRWPWLAALAALVVAALVVLGLTVLKPAQERAAAQAETTVEAPEAGVVMDADSAGGVTVTIDTPSPDTVVITHNGQPVTPQVDGQIVTWAPSTLDDGEHTVVITGDAIPDGKVERTFTVDTTAPELTVETPDPVPAGAAVTIAGATEAGLTVTLNDESVQAGDDGTFTHEFAEAPKLVTATVADGAGNETTKKVPVVFQLPETRSVHLTALAWDYDGLREPVIQMIKDKRITAVQLDIKDESGVIGYDSQVPLAQQTGAATSTYDAKEAIEQLHGMGVRVIGRIVNFRDPKLAEWAWKNGKRDWVIQNPDGTPYYGRYGDPSNPWAFTNFAHPQVRQYNIDLAVEAAELGFDDILYDYVRKPDGKMSKLKVVGVKKRPANDIVEFVRLTREALSEAGTAPYLGLSVYGIAATRPDEIAQDIPALAKHVDYIAPMVYPSHWGPGEYDVANPNAQPYDIVNASVEDFQEAVKGTNAVVVPWLQDFSLGVTYGVPEVKAQIKASRDAGTRHFILWNAGCRYHAEAIPKS